MTNDHADADTDESRFLELRLPSKLGYEKIAMDAASALARRLGISNDRIERLRTALAEAIINAIEHGNGLDAETRVLVVLSARPDELVVRVADQGQRPLELAPIARADRRDQVGGWGIWLIQKLVDEVEFSAAPGGGTQVRMVVHLEHVGGTHAG